MVNLRNGVGASDKNGTKRKRASLLALVNAVMMAGALRAPAADATVQPSPAPTPSTPAAGSGTPKKSGDGSTPSANTSGDASTLQEVVVTAKQEGSYQVTESANDKYTEPLRDTPQSITIIPQSLIKDQNASSLKEALQNVPGITFAAGEGANLSGDNINIRGFSARSDIFVDGFRDTGVYNRDPFNLEQVEVVKGPASAYNGHGSTGGSVNLISKQANLTPSYQASSGYGTDQYYRETVDINQPLGQLGSGWETTAFRLNAMYQYNEHSDRDQIYDSRWGIDPTLTWGLGTDTKVTVDYFHLQEYDLPSYGIPYINSTKVNGQTNGVSNAKGNVAATPSLAPSLNHIAPVDYSNFYGLVNRDFEKTYTDIPTLKVSHDFGEELKIENTSRYENTYRQSYVSPPRFDGAGTGASSPTYLPPNYTTALTTLPQADMSIELRSRRQIDSLLGNQTEFTGKFDTWTFQHDWVFTLEASREQEVFATGTGPVIAADLYNPDSSSAYPFGNVWGPTTKTSLSDYAFSLFDSIKLDPHWILSGGMRFDHADSKQMGNNLPTLTRTDDLPSYRAALTYKPIEPVSVYFGYGTSYNLSIEGTSGNGSTADGFSSATVGLEPEKNVTYEFGTKWDALKEKLSLGAAFFRTVKSNTRITDQTTGFVGNAGTSRVDGIEFSAAGNLTKDWKVFGGWAYMKSEILGTPPGAPTSISGTVGNNLPNVPNQSASLWTTYNLPAHWTIGTGAVFVDSRYSSTANALEVPSYWTQSAMLEYKPLKWLDFQLNVANLWNETYIAATGSNNIPGDGRSVVFTTSVKF